MYKNLLSISIIILAVAIVVVNLWNPFNTDKSIDTAIEAGTSTNNDNVPGADLSQVEEGKPAPDFELTTFEGKSIKLSDYRGKKVILNFWATWCPPCKAEMPHMENFYKENKEKGIEILAVNLTSMDKGPEELEKFIKDYGLTFPIPLDKEGDIGTQYQAFTIPTSYIIDTNGIITTKIIGPMDENMMNNLTKNID